MVKGASNSNNNSNSGSSSSSSSGNYNNRKSGKKQEKGFITSTRLKEEEEEKKSPSGSAYQWLLFTICLFTSAYSFASWRFNHLPTPVPATAPWDVFSEDRARHHLYNFVEEIGYRIVGSKENEDKTVAYIMKHLASLVTAAHEHGLVLEFETQKASGALSYDFLYSYFTNAYSEVQNVVARIYPKGVSPDHAVLVSSHFDSTFGTMGASDAAAPISAMMECLRNLAYTKPHPGWKNAIIFNFNGAEESFLQAAHGFITKHPWASTIGAFVNLEGVGSGGPAILFQVGPHNAWLAKLYAKVCADPFGNVIAQDIFQANLIPGDTDFRIYRDYAPRKNESRVVPGFDVVYFHNGFVYHTHMDRMSHVTPGSLQHLGDNLLPLLKAMAEAKEVGEGATNDDDPIYFDLFRFGMVTFTQTTNLIAAFLLTLLALVFAYQSKSGFIIWSVVWVMVAMVVSLIATVIAAAVVAIVFSISMPWYKTEWIALVLYFPPCLAAAIAVARVWRAHGRRRGHSPQNLQTNGHWGVVFAYLTLAVPLALIKLGTSAVMLVVVASSLAAVLISPLARRLGTLSWIITLLVAAAIPVLVGIYLPGFHLITLGIPTAGKLGNAPPFVGEAVVGAVCWLVVITGFIPMLPSTLRLSSAKPIFQVLGAVWVGGLLMGYLSASYSPDHPKRIFLQHLHSLSDINLRVASNNSHTRMVEAKGMVSSFDPNPTSFVFKALADKARETGQQVPLFTVVNSGVEWLGVFPLSQFVRGHWVPALGHKPFLNGVASPVWHADASLPFLALQQDQIVTGGRRRVKVYVQTHHKCWATLNISTPHIHSWSFTNVEPNKTCPIDPHGAREGPCSYIVRHAGGPHSEQWEWWVEVDPASPLSFNFVTCYHYKPIVNKQNNKFRWRKHASEHSAEEEAEEETNEWLGSFVSLFPEWVSPTAMYCTQQTLYL